MSFFQKAKSERMAGHRKSPVQDVQAVGMLASVDDASAESGKDAPAGKKETIVQDSETDEEYDFDFDETTTEDEDDMPTPAVRDLSAKVHRAIKLAETMFSENSIKEKEQVEITEECAAESLESQKSPAKVPGNSKCVEKQGMGNEKSEDPTGNTKALETGTKARRSKKSKAKNHAETPPEARMYTVGLKGKGLFALRDIKMGERILSEAPLLQIQFHGFEHHEIDKQLRKDIKKLSDDMKASFFSLPNWLRGTENPTEAQRNGEIFQSNSIWMDDQKGIHGIFIKACQIRHSCDANSQSLE